MQSINSWKPLTYTFSYTSNFVNNRATWIMKFSESVSYDLVIERRIPVNDNGIDIRSSRQKRDNRWYQYSILLDGTEFGDINNFCFKDENSALDEIATIITIELEGMSPEEMSPEIADLVQIVKLQVDYWVKFKYVS